MARMRVTQKARLRLGLSVCCAHAMQIAVARKPGRVRRWQLRLLQQGLQGTAQFARALGRESKLPSHLIIGARGEDEALFYLRREGYLVVARQWKSVMYPGDLDLVAWQGDCLCVIEVKTRTKRSEIFTAESAVDQDKRTTLRRLARAYVRRMPEPPAHRRFDVVSVYLEPHRPPKFEHFAGAFAWTAN
jgi:putative endonuclease